MKQNNSPWLTQLDQKREIKTLEKDIETDVVIIGGGIAGITTLYFLLKHTNKKIVLIEGHRLGHGATGHNAGQVVAEFERPLAHLTKEYGMKQAVAGLEMVEQAWDLLSEVFNDTGVEVPFKEFIGYGGYAEIEQLIADLETELIKSAHGLMSFPVLVSQQSGWMEKIPKKFHGICVEVEASVVNEALEISHNEFHAALPEKKATMNSALFTERLASWCIDQYTSRVQIFEMSYVHGVELEFERPLVITNQAKVTCDEVILCTNGFENFYIHDKKGLDIDTKFHHLLQGKVGYMTAYLAHHTLDPMANYYYEPGNVRSADPFTSDPYFYVTRRKLDVGENEDYLLALGGPEVHLEDREIYFKDFDVDQHFNTDAVAFAEKHFDISGFDRQFFWHGLMGYTRTGVRVVGHEPLDPRLLYNLGCNGVGILPSIMGGRKIARHIVGETVQETIFDPRR